MPNLIGKQIKAIRENRGLTQQDLAHKAGISISNLARLELGAGSQNPRIETLESIARGLGIPTAALLKGPSEALDDALRQMVFQKPSLTDEQEKLLEVGASSPRRRSGSFSRRSSSSRGNACR